MSKLQVVPFRARHLRYISPQAGEGMMALAEIAEGRGWAWTAMLLGEPVGAAGVAITESRGEAWAIFSPLVKTMPVGLYKAVAKGLNEIIAESHVKLIVATVDHRDTQAARFLKHLGFGLTKHWYEWKARSDD